MKTSNRTPKKTNKCRFNVTLTSGANRALTVLARDERRSKSNMLEILIRKANERFTLKEAA